MKYCFAIDLKNDKNIIKEYEDYHKSVWPEILDSFQISGINRMEIYRISNRLFMIIETNSSFNLKRKKQLDIENIYVQKWEKLMSKYQKFLPKSKKGEKWKLMKKIFDYEEK